MLNLLVQQLGYNTKGTFFIGISSKDGRGNHGMEVFNKLVNGLETDLNDLEKAGTGDSYK